MADLSSCYFCGAAMDVSLREHRVVPPTLSPSTEQQTTVVLCGTCERKLDRVLDPVVDAATASARAATDANADAAPNRPMHGTGSSTDDAETPEGDAAATVPPSILSDDGIDERDAANAEHGDAQSNDTDGGTPFEVDDTASVFDESANETDGTTTIPDAEADDGGTDGIAFGEQHSDRPSDSPREEERTNDDRTTDADATDDAERTTGRNAAPDTQTTNANATDAGTTSGGATDAGTDPERPAVDPQTYNKVVRLMKNRDLPVARDEIEAIAGSAYDIPDHECEAIIDAAIQRGLVAEDGTDLTYPDGA